MPPWLAWTLIGLLTYSGLGWTLWARLKLGVEPLTTSYQIRRAFEACPQIGILLMLISFALLCDAIPGVNRWMLLFLVVVPLYLLGHSLWGFP